MNTLILPWNSQLAPAQKSGFFRWSLLAVVGILFMGMASQAQAQQFARPADPDISNTNWSAVNTATLWEATDETNPNDNTDYMQAKKSGGGGGTVTADATLTLSGGLTDPVVHTDHIVSIRAWALSNGGSAETVQISLLEGAAEIATWTETLTGTYSRFDHTIATGEAAIIGNYNNLRLRVVTGGIDTRNDEIRITWLQLEVPTPVSNPPTLITPVATTIDTTSAWLGATVQDGAPISERGVYWNTSGPPILENPSSESGTFPAESFSIQSSGTMPAGTLIYFRGYAVNIAGPGYSPDGTFYTEPNQASSVIFNTVAEDSLEFNWTSGSGGGALVVMRLSSTAAVAPSDGNDGYTASTTFGVGGSVTGAGNYVVHVGSPGWITVSGLLSGTSYSVDVYEYAGTGSLINYQQDAPANNSQTTAGNQPSHNLTHNVQCYDCHFKHASVPRDNDQLTVCASCHSEEGQASAKADIALHEVNGGATIVDCGSCHEVHKYDFTTTDAHSGGITAPNISRIRSNTTKYVPQALEPALFQNSIQFAFGQGNDPYNGICQSCHTNTTNHTNHATGNHDHEISKPCTDCHAHNSGFGGGDLCSTCHTDTEGPRRAIIPEFSLASRHLQGAQLDEADCEICHDQTNHQAGSVWLKNADGGASIQLTGNPSTSSTEAVKLNIFCLSCHDSDGANGDTTPFSDNISVPDISTSWETPAAHNDASLSCYGDGTFGCHGNGHASKKYPLLPPPDVDPTPPAYTEEQEGFCYNCHDLDGPAATNIEGLFTLANRHPILPAAVGGNQSGGGRDTECGVCHNPHAATKAPSPRTAGMWSIDQAWGYDPSIPDTVDPASAEYQLCFRCHSDFAGIAPGTNPGDGGPGTPDTALQFDTANGMYHPVLGTLSNSFTNSTTMEPPWNGPGETMWCSDCHRDGTIPGPHGSDNPSMLRGSLNAVDVGNGFYTPLCVTCHRYTSYVSGATGSDFSAHNNSNHLQPDFGGGYGGCLSCHYGLDTSTIHGGNHAFGFLNGSRIVNADANARTCTVIGTDGCKGHTKSY